jgi:predicted nucleic acid-binding protein
MPGRIAFFDTSAIVPLCVAQPGSQKAKQVYRTVNRPVVAWTTLIEATGALYRSVMLGELNESKVKTSLGRLAQLEERWSEIVASERVRDVALELLRMHRLRAGDAIQLASALVWCKEKPRLRSFVCFDEKLGVAAHSVGFDVIAAE